MEPTFSICLARLIQCAPKARNASVGYADLPDPVKASDKIAALDKIARYLGLFVRDNESKLKIDLEPPSDLDTAHWMAFMLAKGRMANREG